MIFDDFTYDFSWEVLKFMISTYHFMVSEEGDARTHGGIISFELSPLKRCMRINSNKGCPRVIESGVRARRRREEGGM